MFEISDHVWTTSAVRAIIITNRNKMDAQWQQNFEQLGHLDQTVVSAQRRDVALRTHDFIGKHGDKDDSEIIDTHDVTALLSAYAQFWTLWESKM
jgi:hypothetical protein